LKRMFNLTSPLGIALTVAGVVLALSPDARRATRRLLVKGTAAVLGAVDQVKEATTTAAEQLAPPVLNTLPSPLAMEERHEEDENDHKYAAELSGIHAESADSVGPHVETQAH
jgi:hypothetical protein